MLFFYLHFWTVNLLKTKSKVKMLGVNLKNRQQKKAFIVGVAVGVFAGAFLPDKYNPVELVKKVLHKRAY